MGRGGGRAPSDQKTFKSCAHCAAQNKPFNPCKQSNGVKHLLDMHPCEMLPEDMLGWEAASVRAHYRAVVARRSKDRRPIYVLGVKWKYLLRMLPGAAYDKNFEIRPTRLCNKLTRDGFPFLVAFSCLSAGAPAGRGGKIVMLATVTECTDDVPEEFRVTGEPRMKLVLGGCLVLKEPVAFDIETAQPVGGCLKYRMHDEAQVEIRAAMVELGHPSASALAKETVDQP